MSHLVFWGAAAVIAAASLAVGLRYGAVAIATWLDRGSD